jgi:hypothetical protein
MPTHNRGPSLEDLADLPPPKRARSEKARPSKLHDVKPTFYDGKNPEELNAFVKMIEMILFPNAVIYHT